MLSLTCCTATDLVISRTTAFEAIVSSAAARRGRPPPDKETPMTVTVLYPEDRQIPDLAVEQEIFGPEVRLIRAAKPSFAELDPTDCAATDGLMIMRWAVVHPAPRG
jgi:hypothetical protein